MDKEILNTENALDQLIEKMEKSPLDFEHIRIFLKSDDSNTCPINAEFLMVSPTSLGKVKLLDVSVKDHFVILYILDCATQLAGKVRININDTRPQTFFIRWQDVRQMVLDETSIRFDNNDLLEFDFENTENQGVK